MCKESKENPEENSGKENRLEKLKELFQNFKKKLSTNSLLPKSFLEQKGKIIESEKVKISDFEEQQLYVSEDDIEEEQQNTSDFQGIDSQEQDFD